MAPTTSRMRTGFFVTPPTLLHRAGGGAAGPLTGHQITAEGDADRRSTHGAGAA
jgi:hypothetical protein